MQSVAGVCLRSTDSWKSILRDLSSHLFPWGVRSELLLLIHLWEMVFNTDTKEYGSPGPLNQQLDVVSLRGKCSGKPLLPCLPQWLKSKSDLFLDGICHCLMELEPEECASCRRVIGYVVDCVEYWEHLFCLACDHAWIDWEL